MLRNRICQTRQSEICFKRRRLIKEKMFLSSVFIVLLYSICTLSVTDQTQHVFSETYSINLINCPNDKKCTFVEHCPAILNLMNHNLLPIHRFRQAICGYENIKPKVCCDVDSNMMNSFFTQKDGASFTRSNLIPECGRSFVHGDVNSIGMYPFVARIGFKSNTGQIKYPCNGVILNQRTILTTASCALAKSSIYQLDSVLVGEFNTDTDPDCNTQKINISYVIKHPNYRSDTFANNIAMLRLKESIQYTVTAQPVCLLPRDGYVNVGMNPILVGWGKLASQKVNTCKQQLLKMRIVSTEECMNYYNQGSTVELCTIGDEEPCSGYNGSPLLFKYGDTYFLLGILSYGSDCSMTNNFPSVFVNIQKYTRWILENC
ncbi:venom protease [Bombus vancouverensis nearcticus]|uniref:venom protease n=1 Tax=Bombus vancouverensis nearcticus TaxID=2705178 RepID=UPI00402B5480